MVGTIVVGTDGSNTATKAVDHAANLALATDAELIAVTVFKKQESSPFEGSTIELGRRVLDEFRERYGEKLRVKTALRIGAAAKAVIGVAKEENADIIVVGNVGMRGSKKELMKNIPNQITHNAPCSVLLVNTEDE